MNILRKSVLMRYLCIKYIKHTEIVKIFFSFLFFSDTKRSLTVLYPNNIGWRPRVQKIKTKYLARE